MLAGAVHLYIEACKAVLPSLEASEELLHERPLMPLRHDVDDELGAWRQQCLGRPVLLHCH